MRPVLACLLGAAAMVVGATLLPAQVADPSRFAESARPLSVPTLLDAPVPPGLSLEDDTVFAPESPGDEDIGQQLILKDTPKQRWFSFLADAFGYWSDNPANVSVGTEDDFFWGGRVSLAAQPPVAKRLYADAFLSQQLYRYDRFDFLDYEYLEGTLGLVYLEPRLSDSVFFVQGRYVRMTNDDFGNDIFDSWSVRAGVQKSFLFDRRNSLHVNLMGDWGLAADPGEFQRSEYIADLSYNFKIMRDLVFGLSYRFNWFDYQDIDRADGLNLVGASLTWSPKKWLDVYLAASFSHNESDIDVFDYDAVNTGGGAGVRIRF